MSFVPLSMSGATLPRTAAAQTFDVLSVADTIKLEYDFHLVRQP